MQALLYILLYLSPTLCYGPVRIILVCNGGDLLYRLNNRWILRAYVIVLMNVRRDVE